MGAKFPPVEIHWYRGKIDFGAEIGIFVPIPPLTCWVATDLFLNFSET